MQIITDIRYLCNNLISVSDLSLEEEVPTMSEVNVLSEDESPLSELPGVFLLVTFVFSFLSSLFIQTFSMETEREGNVPFFILLLPLKLYILWMFLQHLLHL